MTLDPPMEAVTTAPCSVCGGEIPMRLSEYKEMVALGAPVIHREHNLDQQAAPVLKTYHAVVQVFEMNEDGTKEMVAAATAHAMAPTLHAAFTDPLSADLQRKWLKMAESASLGDLPPAPT